MIKINVNEFWKLIQENNYCIVFCDVEHLTAINEISINAGDIALEETLKRIQKEIKKEDTVFRIGGDEFVIITNNMDYANNLAKQIALHNGESFLFNDNEIILNLHIKTLTTSNYDNFDDLMKTLKQH